MLETDNSSYESFLTTPNDAETVVSFWRSIGFRVDHDSQIAGKNIIDDAVHCFRSQLSKFAMVWMIPSSPVKTNKVTKKRRAGPVRRRQNDLRHRDSGCPKLPASRAINGLEYTLLDETAINRL